MTNNNFKASITNFLSLFKSKKKILLIAVIATITSIIISIIIPLKTGTVIDAIIENISINKQNLKTEEKINNFKPFIKEIETINFDALEAINDSATIADLINYGLVKKENINLIEDKEQLLKTKATKFQNINCYDCQENYDYIEAVNSIYKIINAEEKVNIIPNKTEFIIKNILLIFILIIIEFIMHYITNFLMSKLSKEITKDVRNNINKKIFKIPHNYYVKNPQGDILSLITNDIENISSCISTDIIDIINSSILFLSLLIAMFRLSTKLTLIILCIIPFIFIILIINIIKSSKYFKEKQDILGNYNDFILNSYHGYKVITSYNQKENFITKENIISKDLYKCTWKSNFYGSLMHPIVEFSGNINFLIVCVFGGILVINGGLTIGTLQAFLNYARSFNSPLINIASTVGILEEAFASTNRIFNFLNTEEEKEHSYNKIEFNNTIKFNNVNFAYNKKNVLKNIDLTINKGEKIAIVGETGSGKTTLIKLLLGFYKPNNGNITMDGININNLNPKSLRELTGIVLQDSWIFNGTITENINYGSNKNLNLVKKACTLANLDEIVNKLPSNYEYLIDNNKQNLSKGEKQLISIARLFMQEKEILILDEATSNIDIETEAKIQDAINKLMTNKTCLIIAHRLSTIINSDRIIVMHEGKIVEQGTHEDLLKNKSHYYKMYKSQYE